MNIYKRNFDIISSILLIIVSFPLIISIALAILLIDGRPIFYMSERMQAPKVPFKLVKFRTMTSVVSDTGVSGGDKEQRIASIGRVLRNTRLDELPQLFNVLRGNMSLVGPRPPLRQYAEKYPEIYAEVLRSKPGITGLASLHFHEHEEFLLKKSGSVEETDAIYCRACIPRKARLDLIYQNHQSICFDVYIIIKTVQTKIFSK